MQFCEHNDSAEQNCWLLLSPMCGIGQRHCMCEHHSHTGQLVLPAGPLAPHSVLHTSAAASAKSLQSCPTLCDPIDGSPPSSPVPGILQARALEWVTISFSNAWKWKMKVKSLSRVQLLATPWTVAHQAPPSMGFSRQEDWSGAPLPSPSHCRGYFKLLQLAVRGRLLLLTHFSPVRLCASL